MLRAQKAGTAAKDPMKALRRLLSITFGDRKGHFAVILLCIIVSSIAIVFSASFLGTLVDSFIVPVIGVEDPDFGPIVRALAGYGCVILVSVAFTYILSRIMVNVSQDTLFRIRVQMFRKLESLPLSYFDRNAHGNIMSRFSNDTDTLNQLISNSLVIVMQSGITLLMLVVSMLANSVVLTAVVAVFAFLTIRSLNQLIFSPLQQAIAPS